MNKTLIAVILGVVVVGAAAYFFMNSGNVTPGDQEAAVGESASVGATFAELVAMGQSVECTFSYDDGAGNVSSGTVYMAGKDRIRGDFMVSSPAATEMHLIRTDGYTYIWGPALPQGVKAAVTAENEGDLFDTETGAVDPNTQYTCVSWSVDASKFTLPSGVPFLDVEAMLEAAAGFAQ